MTREEAIEFIAQSVKSDVDMAKVADAIKALKQEPVLDKVRAEIEQLRLHKAQFITSDNKVCIDSQEVLNIIDKYRGESEDKK